MKNLLKALGTGALAFVLGWIIARSWIGGLIPALLAGGFAYYWFARQSMKKLEDVAKVAAAAAQQGDVAGARKALEGALDLGKEQFLLAEQVHGQIGLLDYMDAMQPFIQAIGEGKRPPAVSTVAEKLGAARAHFEAAWSRDWRAKTVLAIIHHREGRKDDAEKVMTAASGHAEKEPLFWAVWAWLRHEAGNVDGALQAIGKGLAGSAGHTHLTALQEALSNQRKPDFTVFGDAWLQFFPDQVTRQQLFDMMKAAGKIPADAVLPGTGPQRPANQNFRPVGPTPPPPRGGRMPRM